MRRHPLRLMWGVIVAMSLAIVVSTRARAGVGCCAHCGCEEGFQKVCRLVCEEKKVSITCWGCKHEDFCVPGASKPGCRHCETVCNQCASPDAQDVCSQPQKFVWREWIPSQGAKVYTKKKLMKQTVTKTVPNYKWVVEELCPRCESKCPPVTVPDGIELPPVPPAAAGAALRNAPPSPAVAPVGK